MGELEEKVARAEAASGDARAQVEAAYACDREGDEERAVGFYEAAWRLGLPAEVEEAGFLLGYGSTLKNVGRLGESEAVLRRAIAGAGGGLASRLFLALTLERQGRSGEALAEAIEVCLAHPSEDVARYRRALEAYAAELRGRGGEGGDASGA